MGLLSGSQQLFVHRLCKLYIKENLSSSSDSSDENLIVVDKDDNYYIDQMCFSQKDADRRFLSFFKVMKKEGAINKDGIEPSEDELVFGEKISQSDSLA